MFWKAVAVSAVALLAAGCSRSAGPPRAHGEEAAAMDWRRIATDADRDRLRRWREAWMAALPRAKAEDAAAVARAGALFEFDRALPGAMPPPGLYRCRVFKLGSASAVTDEFTAYPWFRCRIRDEGAVRSLHKLTGSQRPVGLLFEDSDARAVFLGTLVLGDEQAALEYGRDEARDMAGFVERVGENRWRLVLPYPHFESILDVMELVPAG